jgi:hypothetical protein
MSPSEAQLRAALRHGEGDSPDAGVLISHAVRVRRRRQRRIMSIATGTTVVAFVAAGVGVLVSLGGGSGSAGGADSAAAGAGAAVHAPVRAPAAAPSVSKPDSAASSAGRYVAEATPGRATRLACPSAPAHYALPGGGGLGAFGSTEKLFVRSVAAMKICVYPPVPARTPLSTVLTEPAARKFAADLESAPARATSARPCPSNTAAVGSELAVLAVSTDARRLKPVVITVQPCSASQVTNGTAVRYLVTLPTPVSRLLDSALRLRPASGQPANGSPSS